MTHQTAKDHLWSAVRATENPYVTLTELLFQNEFTLPADDIYAQRTMFTFACDWMSTD
jgi:hypothetical protein